MSKTVDVDLRVRAKNLSKSSLREIIGDVESLTASQKEQASSAKLAAASWRDLLAEQRKAASLAKELTKRRDQVAAYASEREEIDKLAAKLVELTSAREKLASASAGRGNIGLQLGGLDKQIIATEKNLRKLADANETARLKLEAAGVDTKDLAGSLGQITSGLDAAGSAYTRATARVLGYSDAVKQASAAQAEAERRVRQEADVARRRTAATVEDAGRANTAAALKADILARDKAAKALAVQAEAERRLRLEQDLETSALARNNAEVRAAISRLNELAVLRADIARRSAETVKQQTAENAAREREAAALEKSRARREALVRVLEKERNQRLLTSSELYKEVNADNAAAASKDKLARSTNKAAKEQQFFEDTGRKSLSIYQRIRGQVLSLIAAYVGVYQAINTVNKAIEAANRDQSLKIGLQTANGGDLKKAASDYKFLREEADRLGLVFDDIAPKYANMLIAAKAVGASAKDTRKLFTDVATSVAAGNLSIDDSEGVFRAVVQVMGKARVQAEELRGQLGDRLPGAVAAFAAANNIALSDLDDHLKKGKGSVEEFLKFMGEYAQKFAPAMEATTDRLGASINRAKNAYNDWLRKLLDSNAQSKLKEAFGRVTQFFNSKDGDKFAAALGTAFGKLVDVIIWLADNVDIVTQALKIFIAVQAVKFGIDLAGSLNAVAKGFSAAGTAAGVFNSAGLLSAQTLGRIKLAVGGLAALFAGVTVALDDMSRSLAANEGRLKQYVNLLDRLGTRQGLPKAATAAESLGNIKDAAAQVKVLSDKLAKLRQLQRDISPRDGRGKLGGTSLVGQFKLNWEQLKSALGGSGLNDLGLNSFSGPLDIQKKINELSRERGSLMEALNEETRIHLGLLKKEATAEEEVSNFPEIKDKPEKKPKGRDPDAVERQREAAVDAMKALVSKAEEDISQTRIQKEAQTNEQIEINRKASIEKIEQDYQQSLLRLDAVRRQMEAAGLKGDFIDPRVKAAKELLDTLRQQQVVRANDEAVIARVALGEKQINELVQERDDKIRLQQTLVETGQQSQITAQQNVNKLQDDYNAKINKMVTDFLAFLQTLPTDISTRIGVPKLIRDMQQAQAETTALTMRQKVLLAYKDDLVNLGNSMVKAFADAYAETGKLSDGFKAAGNAFKQFIADFLMRISQAIIQAIILKAIMNSINGTSGGYGEAVKGALTIMSAAGHTGGVVGSANNVGANPRRRVSPLVFAGAQRFHRGGLPGLKPNEVATILKKGEEVVTENDPRHVANGGMQAGASEMNFTNVNVFDTEEVAGHVMAARATGVALLNFFGRNSSTIKQRLGLPT